MTPSELPNWRKGERARLLKEREALTEEALAGLRSRILRPWTLMMVQKLHENGQPREVSAVAKLG